MATKISSPSIFFEKMDEGLNGLRYSPHLVDNIDARRIEKGMQRHFSRSLKQERERVLRAITIEVGRDAKECFLRADLLQHVHAIQLWLEMEHGLRCEPSLDGLKVYF